MDDVYASNMEDVDVSNMWIIFNIQIMCIMYF